MHRHWNLPAPPSRARLGVRLQPAPVAAPPDQPYHPDSRRLVCRSRSGSLRAGTPPSHHDRGDGIPSVLALIGARDAMPGLWRFRGHNKGACAVVIGTLAVSLGSLQPLHSSPTFGQEVSPGANHALEKKEVLDGMCTVPLGPQSHSAVRQCTGSRVPETLIPRDEESGEEDRPFLPRFLLQEISSCTACTKGSVKTRKACK